MKKRSIIILLIFPVFVFAQKYKVLSSNVIFFSYAPVEDIKAESNQLQGIVDFNNQEFFFRIPMNSFIFPSSLMQEHFNENYVESDLFPLSEFKGFFLDSLYKSKTNHELNTNGTFSIHGVSKEVSILTNLSIQNKKVIFVSKFSIQLKDYDIKIPKMFINNISEEIEIIVKGTLILLE